MDLLFQTVCVCVCKRPVHLWQHQPIPALSSQFDSEFQFDSSVKTLLSRLPKQRYLKCICDELHDFKINKKYVVGSV